MSRHIPISELARALFPASDKVKAIGMLEPLKAYFDDSGTHSDALVTAIGGFVAPTDLWSGLEAEWADALADYRQYGVTWYHATDIAQRQKEWSKVPLHLSADAPLRFARIIGKHKPMPVWAAVVNEDFHKYATPEYLATFPTPFMLCFHEAMGQLYHWARGQSITAPYVVPFVAHGDDEDRMNKAHAQYLVDGDFAEYIGSIGFDSPRRRKELQCSDLIANQYFWHWREMEYPTAPLKWLENPVLRAATQHVSNIGACYSGDGMKYAVERFMNNRQKPN